MQKFVIYTQKLQNVVDKVSSPLGYNISTPSPRRPGRSTFTDRRGSYGSGGSYNGFFKIIADVNKTDNSFTLRVVDGDSYSSKTDTCLPQIAQVNGSFFDVALAKSENFLIKENLSVYVVLRHHAPGVDATGKGQAASVEKVMVEFIRTTDFSQVAPNMSDNLDYAFYLLGSALCDDKEVQIKQYHTSGVAIFYHAVAPSSSLEYVGE